MRVLVVVGTRSVNVVCRYRFPGDLKRQRSPFLSVGKLLNKNGQNGRFTPDSVGGRVLQINEGLNVLEPWCARILATPLVRHITDIPMISLDYYRLGLPATVAFYFRKVIMEVFLDSKCVCFSAQVRFFSAPLHHNPYSL